MHRTFLTQICGTLVLSFLITGMSAQKSYHVHKNKTITVTKITLRTVSARSMVECIILCSYHAACHCGSYDQRHGMCQLYPTENPHVVDTADSIFFTCSVVKDTFNLTVNDNQRIKIHALNGYLDRGVMMFQVRSCPSISIGFHSGRTEVFYVDIALYNDTLSRINYIYESFQVSRKHDTAILSCDSFQALWIAWDTTSIAIGTGRVRGDNVFLSYSHDGVVPQIDGVSTKTGQIVPNNQELNTEVSADWIFDTEKCI